MTDGVPGHLVLNRNGGTIEKREWPTLNWLQWQLTGRKGAGGRLSMAGAWGMARGQPERGQGAVLN